MTKVTCEFCGRNFQSIGNARIYGCDCRKTKKLNFINSLDKVFNNFLIGNNYVGMMCVSLMFVVMIGFVGYVLFLIWEIVLLTLIGLGIGLLGISLIKIGQKLKETEI